MADPAGLVLGIAGLAGLFGTCLQLFDIIEVGSNHERDLEMILCSLKVEKVRFLLWGESAGLWAPDATGVAGRVSPRLHRQAVQSAVLSIFTSMKTTFLRTSTVIDRYTPLGSVISTLSVKTLETVAPNSTHHPESFKRVDSQQETAGIGRKIRWALHDKKLADELISTIRNFNDSLVALVPEDSTQHQLGEISETEVRITNMLRSSGSRCLLQFESPATQEFGLIDRMKKCDQSPTSGGRKASISTSGSPERCEMLFIQ
jgi:hypothetical protein